MNEKGVPPPTQSLLRQLPQELARWLSLATDRSVKARSYAVSVAPGTVSASSEAATTVTVVGVTANDIVIAQKPTRTTNVSVMQAVPGADQVTIVLRNFSGAGIAVPTETWTIFAVRA